MLAITWIQYDNYVIAVVFYIIETKYLMGYKKVNNLYPEQELDDKTYRQYEIFKRTEPLKCDDIRLQCAWLLNKNSILFKRDDLLVLRLIFELIAYLIILVLIMKCLH